MQTIAFKMKLKQGQKEEYKKRHNAIWPKLKKLLKDNGILDYHIFLDEETHILFAVQKISRSTGSQDLSTHKIVREWWEYMADIMETYPDNAPVTVPLEKMFELT